MEHVAHILEYRAYPYTRINQFLLIISSASSDVEEKCGYVDFVLRNVNMIGDTWKLIRCDMLLFSINPSKAEAKKYSAF